MESKSHAFKAGLFAICLVLAALVLMWYLNSDKTERVPYMIRTSHSIPGLYEQANVQFLGLKVGNVRSIELDPDANNGELVIIIDIDKKAPVTASTYASLGYQGITGIASIELKDTGADRRRLVTSEENPAQIPVRTGLMSQLRHRGEAILENVETLTKNLAGIFTEENSRTIVKSIDNIGKAADAWEKIPRELDPSIKQLPQLMEETRELLVNLNETAQKVNRSLGDNGSEESKIKMKKLINQASQTMYNLNTLLEQYRQRPSGFAFGSEGPAPGPGEAGFTGR